MVITAFSHSSAVVCLLHMQKPPHYHVELLSLNNSHHDLIVPSTNCACLPEKQLSGLYMGTEVLTLLWLNVKAHTKM